VTEGLESNGLAAFDASWRDLGDQIAARFAGSCPVRCWQVTLRL